VIRSVAHRRLALVEPWQLGRQVADMKQQAEDEEAGVTELRDKLSQYLRRAEGSEDMVVTRRGKPIARIGPVDPLADLRRRGLITEARKPRTVRRASVAATGSVSDLITEERDEGLRRFGF